MHSSALRIGGKFVENYFKPGMEKILEVGSYDVNGSLRQHKPEEAIWVGADIEAGPGVDVIVEPGKPLPFSDAEFDMVVASSVFEHDSAFWKTMREMSRVTKPGGFIYVSAPSNGAVHRYPLDCFRFYPDASWSLLEILKEIHPNARLVESFIGDQDHENLWNDFVAVFSTVGEVDSSRLISSSEPHTNAWLNNQFVEASHEMWPEDRRKRDENFELLNTSDTLLIGMTNEKAMVETELKESQSQLKVLASEKTQTELQLKVLASEKTQTELQLAELQARFDSLQLSLDAVVSSKTWRWSSFIRKFGKSAV
jgi:SAM-dependent methyltransferase